MAYTTQQLKDLIVQEARRQGVDPALALGIAQAESAFNPQATGDNNRSIGLFQLQPAAVRDVGGRPQERYDVPSNIRYGIAYLKNRIAREGDENRGISAYNQGIGWREGQYSNPQYVRTVRQYQRQHQQSPSLRSRVVRAVSPASAEAAPPPGGGRRQEPMPTAQMRPSQEAMREELRRLEALEAKEEELRRLEALDQPQAPSTAPATPPAAAPSAPMNPRDAYEIEVIPGGTPPAPPTAATQVQMFEQGEQQRLAAERAVGSPTVPAPALAGLGRGAVATGISAGASMLGTAAGTLAAPFTGPLAPAMPLVGEMAGSYLGRQLNVGLGLEEPGLVGDVASVAVPPVLRGASHVLTPLVKRAGKAVIRHLPGAATTMHQEVSERLVRMTDKLLPPVDSRTLYGKVAQQYNPAITPTAVARDAAEILQKEMDLQPALRNSELMRVADDLKKLTQSGTVPMDRMYAHQQRVGELVREARSKGGVGEGRIKQLYAAFHEDLETAASKGIPGAQDLQDAIAASRKEHIAAEFDELFAPGKNGVTIDPEGRISLHGGRMETAWKRTLNRDKVFSDTLSKEEKAEIEGIIKDAQRLERLNVPRGGQRGSGRYAVGAAIGSLIGGVPGAAAGVYGPELIAKAMQTQAGRRLVRQALQETSKGGADTTAINALAALVRQQMNAPAEPPP